jgi:hypothetical protein
MVNDKKKLIVHVGTPKTGTSFLQEVCIKNYEKLLTLGVLYPGVESNSFVKKANVPINASHILKYFFNYSDKEELCDLINAELKIVFDFNINTVLISDETLIAYCVPHKGNHFIFECLIAVCKGLDIELSFVAYYRKPSEYLPSHWAQLVKKHQETRSLLEFVEQENIPYWSNLISLCKLHNNVLIYSYDKEIRETEGISGSFFNIVNINYTELDELKVERVNSSLSLNALTALRLINAEFEHDTTTDIECILSNAQKLNYFDKPGLTAEKKLFVDKLYKDELDILSSFLSNK